VQEEVCDALELILTILNAARKVLDICIQKNWTSGDIDQLTDSIELIRGQIGHVVN